ncbi:MFS transporter [Streptomyces polyrhachis]|uniref:MFS transporter n=1 Tax=Streptomyces polyrhachis TaxID=1282885 RepID=A0ABW2GCJ4_9ACTN
MSTPRDTAPARATRPAGGLRSYGRIFAVPGARAFTAWNLLARLPMGMFGISTVMMIAAGYGSYALAGAVAATGLAANALAGPLIARAVDRRGQARTAVPATVVATCGALALTACVHLHAPPWTLFASYTAMAATPNTGGMSRARWAHLLRKDPGALHTANAFEQAADEVCYLGGPVLAAFLCTALFPEAGTLTAALLMLTGVLLFAAQRSTEPPVAARTRAPAPLRAPGMPPLLGVFAATGVLFGSTEVVTIAYADAAGSPSAAGWVLALQAAGSCAAGLLYGLVRPASDPAVRLRWCLAAMALLASTPLLAASLGGLAALAPALLLAGMATAPTMVTAMGLVQRLTPPERLNEGMTVSVTAILGGIAAGSAAGGWVVEHAAGAAAGYWLPPAAAITAAATSLTLRGLHERAVPLQS